MRRRGRRTRGSRLVVTMDPHRQMLMRTIADELRTDVDEVLRDAFDALATRNGHGAEIKHLRRLARLRSA